MPGLVQTILRNATRDNEGPLNILTFPTHERYQTNLAKTGHFFYLWQAEGIKPWVNSYGEVPENTTLLNAEKAENQIPENLDIDIVLSQNKFGQFNIAHQIAEQIAVPVVSIEHTLPMEEWSDAQLKQLHQMRGDINIFISDYSRGRWGWSEEDALVLHHGVDTELFSIDKSVEREKRVLSVVNDWVNRDWCCGYKLWEEITDYPDSSLPLHVIGDTPGLSSSAPSTEALVEQYRKSSVFLNTSIISPVPTSLLEAMACGCAVVTTATCMIPEIIQNGENGYMSNDPKELRGFVDKLLHDDELAQEIGANARKTILENFSIENFVEQWKNVFYECVR
jgi:hypothetical protein